MWLKFIWRQVCELNLGKFCIKLLAYNCFTQKIGRIGMYEKGVTSPFLLISIPTSSSFPLFPLHRKSLIFLSPPSPLPNAPSDIHQGLIYSTSIKFLGQSNASIKGTKNGWLKVKNQKGTSKSPFIGKDCPHITLVNKILSPFIGSRKWMKREW